MEWKEEDSPYVPVARVFAFRVNGWMILAPDPVRVPHLNPWNSLARSIARWAVSNRARRAIYPALNEFRRLRG